VKHSDALLALAAANAEIGAFEEAAKWQRKAIELLKEAGDPVDRELDVLKLYESGLPLRNLPRQIDHKLTVLTHDRPIAVLQRIGYASRRVGT